MSKLHECDVPRLHPTQITVGMIEVHDKRKYLRHLGHQKRHEYLREHPIPAVLGPNGKVYITDHHHLGRALDDEGIEHGFFLIEEDYSLLPLRDFWQQMNVRRWVHPIDEYGKRREFKHIPAHLKDLMDDPYRSLAGYVRDAGGYVKSDSAFAEFAWADFYRLRLVIGSSREDFDAAVAKALQLAHSEEAHDLPGFIPPSYA